MPSHPHQIGTTGLALALAGGGLLRPASAEELANPPAYGPTIRPPYDIRKIGAKTRARMAAAAVEKKDLPA